MSFSYIFPPAEQPSVAVRGSSARYAVSRIFCVGRNYAAHRMLADLLEHTAGKLHSWRCR